MDKALRFSIDAVVVRVVRLPLKEPFPTAFGTIGERDQIIVEVQGGGLSGWGEAAVLPFPFYNHETAETALHLMRSFLIPLFFKARPSTPSEVAAAFEVVAGNRIARAGIEMAYWDWYARAQSKPLYSLLGGERREISVGVAVPLVGDQTAVLERITRFLEEGYQRIKIKVAPGHDVDVVGAIMKRFGALSLMVDANSAYDRTTVDRLIELDRCGLMMIEQPLRRDDLLEHAALQARLKTPICLDESIEHVHAAAAAFDLGSCRIINIKPGRVGGLTEAVRIHDLAVARGYGVWCGGLLETGVGRAANLALASLSGFRYPGDISASTRYFHEDIVDPDIVLTGRGTIEIPAGAGSGYTINRERLERYTRHAETFRPDAV